MNVRLPIVLLSVLAVCLVPIVADGGDAASLEDAPDAKYVIDLGDYTLLKSSSPMSFDLLDAFGDQTGLDQLSTYQGIYIGGISNDGLPGWITIEKSYTGTMYEDFVPDIQLVVDPLYVAGSTDYWCHSNLMGGILWTITVEVQDSDPTITPSGTYNYRVNFDTMGGEVLGPVSHQSHNDSWSLDPSGYVPVREGYDFVGWSYSESGDSIIRGDISLDGIPDELVSVTVYAVWEPAKLVIPTFWDGLIELVSNPIILLLCLIMFLAVCLFIRNRNTGGYR